MHRSGLSTPADYLYTLAVAEGALEWAVKETTVNMVTLDLHGTNVAVAVAGVRVGLRETFRNIKGNEVRGSKERRTGGAKRQLEV